MHGDQWAVKRHVAPNLIMIWRIARGWLAERKTWRTVFACILSLVFLFNREVEVWPVKFARGLRPQGSSYSYVM
jgi:hypothetical protein